ncbi:MAG TPA: phage Gp37/Gp68 family protein [Vicinamibacterales bacterium]|nr:phage Gp37/Gp68 family protein [Vicinamibacterales bacterium]
MAENSSIEWTDSTWPVVTGCDYASPGCANCYAVRDARRLSHNPNPRVAAAFAGVVEPTAAGKLRWTGRVNCLEERLDWPLKWKRPRKIFVCNQSDLFHEDVPQAFIIAVFNRMARAPQHTFQVLTKRPARMREMVQLIDALRGGSSLYANWPLPNVWLGVSVENQRFADERIPLLLQTPAAVRFISAEPLLGPLELRHDWLYEYRNLNPVKAIVPAGAPLPRLSWVIVGGESGKGARPFDLAWARSIVQQCQAAGTAVFVKQLGAKPLEFFRRRPEDPQHVEGWTAVYSGDQASWYRYLRLKDKKGGTPDEWPHEGLRVREFPEVAPCRP